MPRTVVVTGGSPGIGFGIATCFARLASDHADFICGACCRCAAGT